MVRPGFGAGFGSLLFKGIPKWFFWVPEGSLAGFWGGAFLRSGRPRGPGKAFEKVGCFAPHLSNGFVGRRGRPNPKNRRCPASPKTMYYNPTCIWFGAMDVFLMSSQITFANLQNYPPATQHLVHRIFWEIGRDIPFGRTALNKTRNNMNTHT